MPAHARNVVAVTPRLNSSASTPPDTFLIVFSLLLFSSSSFYRYVFLIVAFRNAVSLADFLASIFSFSLFYYFSFFFLIDIVDRLLEIASRQFLSTTFPLSEVNDQLQKRRFFFLRFPFRRSFR